MSLQVAGVDPGLTRCGLALVSVAPDRTATLQDVRVIGSSSQVPLDQRILTIAERVDEWLDEHTPDALAIERVFTYTNVSTVMGTAQVTGVVIAAAARRGIPVALHTPTEVKAAVTGNGQAGKHQVTRMVTKILRLGSPPKPADAADAIAIALAHGWRGADPASKAAASASNQGGIAPAQRAWAQAQANAANGTSRAEAMLLARAQRGGRR